MITLFACPKGFSDERTKLFQLKALESWLLLNPRPQIILLGDEEGIEQICRQYDLEHIPHIERSPYGAPILSSIFKKAVSAARHEIIAYVNADIVISSRIYQAIQVSKSKWKDFVLVSAPHIIEYENLNLVPDFEKSVSILKKPIITGADLFIFTRHVYQTTYGKMPPLRIGRLGWDNWLMAAPMKTGIPVVDGTDYLLTFHPKDHTSTHTSSEWKDYLLEEGPSDYKFNLSTLNHIDKGIHRSHLPYYFDNEGNIHQRILGGHYATWLSINLRHLWHDTAPLRYKLGLYRWWRSAPWREEIRGKQKIST